MPSHLAHHFDIGMTPFQSGRKLEAQGCFPDAMAAYERDLHCRNIVAGVMSFEL
jgi:hypothetical protein